MYRCRIYLSQLVLCCLIATNVQAAVIYFTGFENGSTENLAFPTGTYSFSTTTVKTGTYAFRTNPTTTAVGGTTYFALTAEGRFPEDTANGTAYIGFDFSYATKPAGTSEPIFTQDNYAGTLKLELRITSGGLLAVYDTTGTLVATGSTVLAQDTWYFIQLKTGNGAAAAYEVKINGTTELSGTCNQEATDPEAVRLGKYYNRNGNSVDFFYDNFTWGSTAYVGRAYVNDLVPISNGTTTDWASGTNSSNYAEMDETPADDNTTYTATAVAVGTKIQQSNLQSLTTIGVTPSAILAVRGTIRSREASTVVSSTQIGIYSGGSSSLSNARDGTTAYANQDRILETDPATSAAWTVSGVNAIQVGAIDSSAFAVRCTQQRASILYTVSTSGKTGFGALLGAGN